MPVLKNMRVGPPGSIKVAPTIARLKPGPQRAGLKIGRNSPCPCGSGKKFKECCMPPIKIENKVR